MEGRGRRRRVTSVNFGNKSQPQDIDCYKLYLRFEGSIKALEGVLSVTKDSKNDTEGGDVALYTLNCESKYKDKIPYALTVYRDTGGITLKYRDMFTALLQEPHFTFQSTIRQRVSLSPISTSVFYQNLRLKIPPEG